MISELRKSVRMSKFETALHLFNSFSRCGAKRPDSDVGRIFQERLEGDKLCGEQREGGGGGGEKGWRRTWRGEGEVRAG